MFTGLIEAIGTVSESRPGRGSTRLRIESDLPVESMADGESVAVDGACLTVVGRDDRRFWADAIAETLSRTTLGKLRAGSRVNLERAVRVGDRLGGHLVQGHVDTTVKVRDVRRRGDDYRLRLERSGSIARYVAYKGSVAIQGVSLTISAVTGTEFEVALIPATLARTTLSSLRPGSDVNVEVDLLARYLESILEGSGPLGRVGKT